MMPLYGMRWTLLLLTSCGGCASVSVRYYTLTPIAVPAAAISLRASVPADAVSVRLPTQDSRSEMIVRHGNGELVLLDNERWASPLADQIRDAVRIELQREFNGSPAFGSEQGPIRVLIDVQRMDAELDRYTVLEATWTGELASSSPGKAGSQTCTFRSYEPIGPGYDGIVQGYQRQVQALAAAIGAEIISSLATGHGGCGAKTLAHR